MKKLNKYSDGIDTKQFIHIPNISCYNYYQGFDDDLLYGESYTSENEKLHRYDKP